MVMALETMFRTERLQRQGRASSLHRWPQKDHRHPPPCVSKAGDFGLVNTVPHISEMAKQKCVFSPLPLGI